MRRLLCLFAVLLVMPAKPVHAQAKSTAAQPDADFVLVIHGGAGVVLKEDLTPEKEKASRATLDAALLAGHSVLARGGKSLDEAIALDTKGNVAMPFNTEGMYRGVIRADGQPWTAIRKE